MNDWRKCLVRRDTPMLEVLRAIDVSAMQFALVLDDEDRLFGLITDGDIRRALLRGIPLEEEAEHIANKSPTVFEAGQKKRYVTSQMKKRNIRQAPVVDDLGHIIGLYVLEDLLIKQERDNPVILMAGGLGTRLRPLTENCPKPLLKVGSKPILETILENFIDSGFHRFYFAVNYRSEMIEDYFGDGSRFDVEINYLHEKKRLGTAGALSLLNGMVDRPTIVMNGDLLTKMDFGDFLDFHVAEGAMATMAVREHSYQVPYGVIRSDGHRMVSIVEKPTQTFYVNAGMYVLSPEAVAHVREEKFLDMPDLFNELIREGNPTSVYPVSEYWMDIGHMDDFRQAQVDYAEIFKG